MPELNPFSDSIREDSLLPDLENILRANEDRNNPQHSNINLLNICNNGLTVLSDLFCLETMRDINNLSFVISQLASYTYGKNEETLLHLLVKDQTIPDSVFMRAVDVLINLGANLNSPDGNGKTATELSKELGLYDKFNTLTQENSAQEKRGKKIELKNYKDLGNGCSIVPLIIPRSRGRNNRGGQVKLVIARNNNLPNRGLGDAPRSFLKPLPRLNQSQNLGGAIDELNIEKPHAKQL